MTRLTARRIVIAASGILLVFFFAMRHEKAASGFDTGAPLIDSYRACIDPAKSQQEKGLCLKNLAEYAGAHATTAGIDTAIESMTGPQELTWCHEFLHYAGWGLYKKTKNISDAFLAASSKCDSGMFHGIIEEYISEQSEGRKPEEFIAAAAQTACEDDMAKNNVLPAVRSICYHGLGHAFMFITGNDLPKALGYCDALPAPHPGECHTGAFMENVQSKQIGRLGTHPSAYAHKPDDYDYPCNILDTKHKDSCYRYMGISFVVRTRGDFKQAFTSCLRVDPAYRDICFWGIGSDVPNPEFSSSEAGKKCGSALEVSEEAYRQCIRGGMSFLVQLNLGNPQAVNEFCGAIKSDYRDICFRAAGANLRSWVNSDNDLKEKCGQLPDTRARNLCLKQDNRMINH